MCRFPFAGVVLSQGVCICAAASHFTCILGSGVGWGLRSVGDYARDGGEHLMILMIFGVTRDELFRDASNRLPTSLAYC